MNNNETQRLQNQAVDLLDLIEDVSEQFYIMMKALVDCKLKEFPFVLDFEDFEEEIDDD